MEARFDASGLEDDLISLNRAQASLFQRLAEEEIFWKQKSRVKWLKEGDRNTRLFHSSLVQHWARQFIGRIQDDTGSWVEDMPSIQAHAVVFFQRLLSEPISQPAPPALLDDFLQDIPSLIGQDDNLTLMGPVSLQEVREAVFQLDEESASGPDGFSGFFFRNFWSIISQALLTAVQEFFSSVPIPKAAASTVITLLPKKPSSTSFF